MLANSFKPLLILRMIKIDIAQNKSVNPGHKFVYSSHICKGKYIKFKIKLGKYRTIV